MMIRNEDPEIFNEHAYVDIIPYGDTESWPIDILMIPVLRELWDNDIKTRACCQGYVYDDAWGYIYFDESVKDIRPALDIMERHGFKNMRVSYARKDMTFRESPRGRVAKAESFSKWHVRFDPVTT